MPVTTAPRNEGIRITKLGDLVPPDAALGSKAATLSRLRAAGLPVPDGFVIEGLTREHPLAPDVVSAIAAALAALGPGPVAVRSSAAAEDLPNASFAGQYDTVLGPQSVGEVIEAITTVERSAASARAGSYRPGRTEGPQAGMSVLVQRLVDADAAGVAFTADPVTGDRSTTLVAAVQGLGDRPVSGSVTPAEWEVRDGAATLRREGPVAIDAETVARVAALAREVERLLGGPQDIEWAAQDARLFLLQARPMTALPQQVSWDPGRPGVWLRNFRFGEWLGDPVTPLFESWPLRRIESRFNEHVVGLIGVTPAEPQHVVVNGWYFYGFNSLPSEAGALLRLMLFRVLPRFLLRPRTVASVLPPIARLGIRAGERHWREQAQPTYRQIVARAAVEVPDADPRRLLTIVDELSDAAGEYFYSLAVIAGYAHLSQLPLARFYDARIGPATGGSHLDLLAGLGGRPPQSAPHAVHSLDWIHPTHGESLRPATAEEGTTRHEAARRRRLAAEAVAREAVTSRRQRARFDRLLGEAQHYAAAREEVAAEFTLAWPVLRAATLRLGALLVELHVIDEVEQIFFLTPAEVLTALRPGGSSAPLTSRATARRETWMQQRRLAPPLMLGVPPKMFARIMDDAIQTVRGPAGSDQTGLDGIPASAGRATGPARVVHEEKEFDRVRLGDVLVAPLTAPAWTELFGRIAAVVTDTGGVAAHASIVAREYGIPAVVGTGNATVRFHDGQRLLADGSAGTVRPIAP